MSTSSEFSQDTHFDVREIPCRIKHGQIVQRWLDLPVGSYFILVNDHDPVPLYYQFDAQFPGAFTWDYVERGPEVFQVRITKVASIDGSTPAPATRQAVVRTSDEGIDEIDARGLMPPEPLVRILAALETLAPGRKLRAITDREPCHLFGEAEQRGFRHSTEELCSGSWVTTLERV